MNPAAPIEAGAGTPECANLAVEADRLQALPPTWPIRRALALIRLYQRLLSPILPALLGPNYGCRFTPSCSEYAAGAVAVHGVASGCWLAACRLACCQPFHRGGHDPVPPRRSSRLRDSQPPGVPSLDLTAAHPDRRLQPHA